MKGIRESVTELLIDFIKEIIAKYTDLTEKEISISSSIQLPYLHFQETIMIVVDVGTLQTNTPTMQPLAGIPYHDALQYELLVGSANFHCISKLELHADRLASLLYTGLSAMRRELSNRGFLDIVPQAIAEPIVIFDDEAPNNICYFDVPLVVNFSVLKQYVVTPAEPDKVFRKADIFAEYKVHEKLEAVEEKIIVRKAE
ncbi:MAG: hypothetical protein QXE80_03275 [Pyrobaculum sp.]